MVSKVNPRDSEKEAPFIRRIDSFIDGAYLYEDDTCKAVAMSCVPQEI